MMDILQNLWCDTAGRIFLITFTSYLFAYMIYGGYMFTFLGKKGSLPFGLVDFSIADLISIFPSAIITIIDIIPKAFIQILKGLFLYLVIPLVIGLFIRSVTGFRLNQFALDPTWIGSLAVVGIVLWLTGYLLAILQPLKIHWAVPIFVETLGAILFFAAIPNSGEPAPVIPAPTNQTQQGIDNLLGIILTLEIVAIPFTFGVGIARTTIRLNFLIKINRLILRQPILRGGIRKITVPNETRRVNSFQDLWLAQKSLPVNIEPEVYEWMPGSDKEAFLLATFEKFVIIYEPGLGDEDNHIIMMNRDVILSIEFTNKAETKTH
jgi:hypothetical protein